MLNRLFHRSYPFVLQLPVHRTTHYIDSSFFKHIALHWTKLPAERFAVVPVISVFKSKLVEPFRDLLFKLNPIYESALRLN